MVGPMGKAEISTQMCMIHALNSLTATFHSANYHYRI